MSYPRLRTVRYAPNSLKGGVEMREVDGTRVRITSVAKTVADCFKFRSKVGLDVALEAMREARRSKRASTDDLWRYARINRVVNVIRPYVEALS
jgi:predicted transcriptional regulator of viral defense system